MRKCRWHRGSREVVCTHALPARTPHNAGKGAPRHTHCANKCWCTCVRRPRGWITHWGVSIFQTFIVPIFCVQKNCVSTGPRALEEGSGPPRPRTLDPRVLSTDPCSVLAVPAALGRRPLKLKSVNGKSAIQFGEIQALIIATTTPHR